MHLSKPAMLFSILLINPTSLFTNALPADGPLSSRTSPIQAQAVAFDLPLCPTANNSLYTAKVVTRDICTSLTTPSSINVKGYLSGAAANMNVDSKRFNCKISYYAGSECSGSPLGETAAIGPDAGLGPCVDFIFSSQGLSTLQLRANSALLTSNWAGTCSDFILGERICGRGKGYKGRELSYGLTTYLW